MSTSNPSTEADTTIKNAFDFKELFDDCGVHFFSIASVDYKNKSVGWNDTTSERKVSRQYQLIAKYAKEPRKHPFSFYSPRRKMSSDSFPAELIMNGSTVRDWVDYEWNQTIKEKDLIRLYEMHERNIHSLFGRENSTSLKENSYNCESTWYCPEELIVHPEGEVYRFNLYNPHLELTWNPDPRTDSLTLLITWHEGVSMSGSPIETGMSSFTIPDNGRLKIENTLLKEIIALEKRVSEAGQRTMRPHRFTFRFQRSNYELTECNGERMKNVCYSQYNLGLRIDRNRK